MNNPTLIITNSRYWYKRYIKERNLNPEETIWINDSYQMQGYSRDTKVIMTIGSNRLDIYTINKARERFDRIERDFLD